GSDGRTGDGPDRGDGRRTGLRPSGRQEVWGKRAAQVALIGLGTMTVPLDSSVNIAFPDIVASFGLPIPTIQWVVICYVLTHASLMLAFGRIGDLFTYGGVFRAGLACSTVAFILCAAAPSFGFLLAARVLQGVG